MAMYPSQTVALGYTTLQEVRAWFQLPDPLWQAFIDFAGDPNEDIRLLSEEYLQRKTEKLKVKIKKEKDKIASSSTLKRKLEETNAQLQEMYDEEEHRVQTLQDRVSAKASSSKAPPTPRRTTRRRSTSTSSSRLSPSRSPVIPSKAELRQARDEGPSIEWTGGEGRPFDRAAAGHGSVLSQALAATYSSPSTSGATSSAPTLCSFIKQPNITLVAVTPRAGESGDIRNSQTGSLEGASTSRKRHLPVGGLEGNRYKFPPSPPSKPLEFGKGITNSFINGTKGFLGGAFELPPSSMGDDLPSFEEEELASTNLPQDAMTKDPVKVISNPTTVVVENREKPMSADLGDSAETAKTQAVIQALQKEINQFKKGTKVANETLKATVDHMQDRMHLAANYLPEFVKSTKQGIIHRTVHTRSCTPAVTWKTLCGWHYHASDYTFVEGDGLKVSCSKCLNFAQSKEEIRAKMPPATLKGILHGSKVDGTNADQAKVCQGGLVGTT
eukprot:Skav221535  [mRNA]  locus=scaffold1813:50830:62531:+ [translate_table: standard]